MFCNGNNHTDDCTCGFGGDYYVANWHFSLTSESQDGQLISYPSDGNDFCRRTNCPECKEEVYFIRHNGGSVWIDPPCEWPWEKHRHCNSDSDSAVSAIASSQSYPTSDLIRNTIGLILINNFHRKYNQVYLIKTISNRIVCLSHSSDEPSKLEGIVAIIEDINGHLHLVDKNGTKVRVRNYMPSSEDCFKFFHYKIHNMYDLEEGHWESKFQNHS